MDGKVKTKSSKDAAHRKKALAAAAQRTQAQAEMEARIRTQLEAEKASAAATPHKTPPVTVSKYVHDLLAPTSFSLLAGSSRDHSFGAIAAAPPVLAGQYDRPHRHS